MAEQKNLGYDDTPLLPNSPYRVHDGTRPQPPVVTPGTVSSQEWPGRAPSDAVILFDGSSLDGWESIKGGDAPWTLADGFMEVVPRSGNIRTRTEFGDCQLHLEFATPTEIKGESQGRGNSGVFLMGLYEIQVLDCYQNLTYPDGTTGGVYGQCPPLANACRAPGEWQCYDIIWSGPLFDRDKLVKKAYLTVLFNGVLLHHHFELHGPTHHKTLSEYVPHPPVGPLMLQDHGDLVRFRNIWYRPLKGYDQA